jgi:hypothetical protein
MNAEALKILHFDKPKGGHSMTALEVLHLFCVQHVYTGWAFSEK